MELKSQVNKAADCMECMVKKLDDHVTFRSLKKRDEFSYGREPKVKRITMGENQGITELILREF